MASYAESYNPTQGSWDEITPQSFWNKADAIQEMTMSDADNIFSYLATAPIFMLREILTQYRFHRVLYR